MIGHALATWLGGVIVRTWKGLKHALCLAASCLAVIGVHWSCQRRGRPPGSAYAADIAPLIGVSDGYLIFDIDGDHVLVRRSSSVRQELALRDHWAWRFGGVRRYARIVGVNSNAYMLEFEGEVLETLPNAALGRRVMSSLLREWEARGGKGKGDRLAL